MTDASDGNRLAAGQATERWSTRLGFILAAMGSAVGLGSIWKFPYEVGENGGLGFLVFYLLGLLLVVVPLLLAEFAIGRRGRADAATSIARAASAAGASPRWRWAGWLGIAAGFLVLSYYAVIAGMTIGYTAGALAHGFQGLDADATRGLFGRLTGDPLLLSGCQAAFLAVTGQIVARGIGGGVETACKILMPVLAALMILLVVYAAIEGDWRRSVAFLFELHPDDLSPRIALEALGLGFFSIGVGLGLMITYAAYAGPQFQLGRTALVVIAGDTAISVLAGLAIFPLVFRYDLDPAGGAALMFLTLPIAFGRLPFGDVVGAGFFLLLFVAALASALSLLELVVAPLIRQSGWSRRRATVVATFAIWLAGLPTVLSFGRWRDVRPLAVLGGFADLDIFKLVDGLASNVMLPAGGLLIALLVGWRLAPAMLEDELGWHRGARLLWWLLRWIVPPLILAFVVAGHLLP
jgi:NSS family neurotransmitter:Na+ symporter